MSDDYQKEYWESNREEISKRRKNRYDSDPVFRRRIQQRSRTYYRQRNTDGGSDTGRSLNEPRVFDGEICYSSGHVVQQLDEAISRQTLLKWARQEVIPKDAYFLDQGKRTQKWFRGSFVQFLSDHIEVYEGMTRLDEWSEFLREEWNGDA